jgi:hypothetical protein
MLEHVPVSSVTALAAPLLDKMLQPRLYDGSGRAWRCI